AAPYAAQIRRPALVRQLCPRYFGLDPRALPKRSLAHLPALELEDPLHRVLVHAQQGGHSPVAERWLSFDHGFDRLGQLGFHPRRRLRRLVVHATTGHAKPLAQLGHRHHETLVLESLLDREHQLSSLPSREASFFRARISSIASP